MSSAPLHVGSNPAETSPASRSPLILLPGLGGDSRLFQPQRTAFPELIVPDWIEPERREPLAHYAARLAAVIDPNRPCFVGGVSFGGAVAVEVATHLATRECFLLGSIRSRAEIPLRLRVFHPMTSLVMIPKWLSPFALSAGGRWLDPMVRGVLHQLKDADQRFLKWAAHAILNWTPSPEVQNVRVTQIHGDRDFVFPLRKVAADKIVPGAGHLVSLTRSKEVNQYLRERMSAAE